MLPTKFLVNWPFGSREEATNRVFKMTTMAIGLSVQEKKQEIEFLR